MSGIHALQNPTTGSLASNTINPAYQSHSTGRPAVIHTREASLQFSQEKSYPILHISILNRIPLGRVLHKLFDGDNVAPFGIPNCGAGNASTWEGSPELLDTCFVNVPRDIREIRLRADSGFGFNPVLEGLEKRGVEYAVVARMTSGLRRLLPSTMTGPRLLNEAIVSVPVLNAPTV